LQGLKSDPDISIPSVVLLGIFESLRDGGLGTLQKIVAALSGDGKVKAE
jgi:hypothetical protein